MLLWNDNAWFACVSISGLACKRGCMRYFAVAYQHTPPAQRSSPSLRRRLSNAVSGMPYTMVCDPVYQRLTVSGSVLFSDPANRCSTSQLCLATIRKWTRWHFRVGAEKVGCSGYHMRFEHTASVRTLLLHRRRGRSLTA
jgi:hypothetical protein